MEMSQTLQIVTQTRHETVIIIIIIIIDIITGEIFCAVAAEVEPSHVSLVVLGVLQEDVVPAAFVHHL